VFLRLQGTACTITTDPAHPIPPALPVEWIGTQSRQIIAKALWHTGGWRATMALFTQGYAFAIPATSPSAHALVAARAAGLLDTTSVPPATTPGHAPATP